MELLWSGSLPLLRWDYVGGKCPAQGGSLVHWDAADAQRPREGVPPDGVGYCRGGSQVFTAEKALAADWFGQTRLWTFVR